MKRQKIALEVKEQIINRIKNDGVTVSQAALDHGIAENTIYAWIAKKVEGGGSISEIIRLKKENAQLFQLIGEITLRLSETQKKKWSILEWPPKFFGPKSLGCHAGLFTTNKSNRIKIGNWNAGLKSCCEIIPVTAIGVWLYISS